MAMAVIEGDRKREVLAAEVEELRNNQLKTNAVLAANMQPHAPAINAVTPGAQATVQEEALKFLATQNGGKKHRGRKRTWLNNDMGNGNRSIRGYPGSTNYCWTCGFDLAPGHTSATCKHVKDGSGHKKEATIDNMMGGTDRNTFHYDMEKAKAETGP